MQETGNVVHAESVSSETLGQHSQAASSAPIPRNRHRRRRVRKRMKSNSADDEQLEQAGSEQEMPQQKLAREMTCLMCKEVFDDNEQFARHIDATKHHQGSNVKSLIGPVKFVHITGLMPGCDMNALEDLMGSFGKIINASYSFRGRGATFEYEEYGPAAAALKFGRIEFAGRKLTLRPWRSNHYKAPVDDSFEQMLRQVADHLPKGGAEEQLAELEQRMTDSAASRQARLAKIIDDFVAAVGKRYPGMVVHPFGSSFTGLAFVNSDVDLFVELPVPDANCVSAVAERLRYTGLPFFGVTTVHGAKTPLVKFHHLSTGLSCDVSFKNCLGVRNSRLLSNYMNMHPLVRQLMLVVKFWARIHGVGNGHGGVSSYALVLMVVFHLQRLGLVPPVADLLETGDRAETVDGWACGLSPTTEKKIIDPSLATLVKKFFTFYGSFYWEQHVVCPLLGTEVAREDLIDPEKLPSEMEPLKSKLATNQSLGFQSESSRLLCVQDPFALDHNLMRGAHSGNARQLMNLIVASDNAISRAGESQVLPRLLSARVAKKANAMCGRLGTVRIARPQRDEDEKGWSAHLWKTLAKVLMSVLKLRVTPIVAGKANRMVELGCHGYHDIISGRKMAEFQLVTEDPEFVKLSPIDRQVAISDRLLGAAVVKILDPKTKGADTLASKISDSLRNSLRISEHADDESDSEDLHTRNAFGMLDGIGDDDFGPEDGLEDEKDDSEEKVVGAEEANSDEGFNFMKDVDLSWDSSLIDPLDCKPTIQFTVRAKRRRDNVVIIFQNNGTYGQFIEGLTAFVLSNLKDWLLGELKQRT